MTRPAAFLAAALLLSPTLAVRQVHAQTLLALSKHDHTVALVDPASLHVGARVPVGDDPHEVVSSSDGRYAFVSNYGGGTLHTLARIDLAARTALAPIDLGPLTGPHGLAFVDGKVWFTAEGAKVIGRFDPGTQKVDWVLGTGQNRTHMLQVAPGGEHIITTNVSSGTVDIIDREIVRMPPAPPGMAPGRQGPPPQPRKDWNEVVVKVGNGSEGFDVSPDGREIWVANAQDGTISVIDQASKQVVQTIAADVRSANRLKFTLDGRHVLVSTLAGGNLVILDPHTRAVTQRLPIGHGAAGILIEPAGNRAFVACTPDNYIAVIDLKNLSVTGHIDVGPEPDGLAWAPAQ